MGKGIVYSAGTENCPAWDARIEPQAAMGRARGTRHGAGSGKRSGRKESEGQAYCMKRIKERAQR